MIVRATLGENSISKTITETKNWQLDIANEVVKRYGKKSAYNKQEFCDVKIEKFVCSINQADWQTVSERLKVELPRSPMQADDFEMEASEILKDIPESFANWIRGWAYDNGHSAGYEEILGYVSELAESLSPAISQYREEIINKFL